MVDGHALGALELNFNLYKKVSAYAGNLHKWMMAPKGTGFGWLNPQWQNQYQPISGSWTTFETKSNIHNLEKVSALLKPCSLLIVRIFHLGLLLKKHFNFGKKLKLQKFANTSTFLKIKFVMSLRRLDGSVFHQQKILGVPSLLFKLQRA